MPTRPKELAQLNDALARRADARGRARASGSACCEIHADQVFTIGIVDGVPQPVVVSDKLQNVPDKGIYNWDPGAYFGIYRPDTFWFDKRSGAAPPCTARSQP